MESSLFALVLLILCLTPISYLIIGRLCNQLLTKHFAIFSSLDNRSSLELGMGVVIHTLVSFGLLAIGAGWIPQLVICIVLPLLHKRELKAVISRISSGISWQFALWLVAVSVLAVTRFEASSNGVQTIWLSNYGDLPFHIGVITALVFQNTLPLTHPEFAGAPFHYHFFADLWIASFWWIDATVRSLPIIFAAQFILCWAVVYQVLVASTRCHLLPWALLFGGGSLSALWKVFDGEVPQLSHQLIAEGYPWTVFVSTLWVPQPAALFGLVPFCIIAVLASSVVRLKEAPDKKSLLFLGVFAGLIPLFNIPYWVVLCAFIALLLFIETEKITVGIFAAIIFSFSAIAVSLIFSNWLPHGNSTLSFHFGWMSAVDAQFGEVILAAGWKWIRDVPLLLVIWIVVLRHSQTRYAAIVIGILFLTVETFQFTVWDWDRIKLFVPLYLLVLLFFGFAISEKRWQWQLLLLPFIMPALLELTLVFGKWNNSSIFSRQDFAVAAQIQACTKPNEIVAAAALHNSPVLLTGRTLYLGYDGHLWSHGVDYAPRRQQVDSWRVGYSCENAGPACPHWLLLTEREQQLGWNQLATQSTTLCEGILLPTNTPLQSF